MKKPHPRFLLIAINNKISYIDYSYSNSRKKHGIYMNLNYLIGGKANERVNQPRRNNAVVK